MKKLLTKTLAMLLAVGMMLTATGCDLFKTSKPPVDSETLAIQVVNKGYGDAWVQPLIDAFKADTGKKAVYYDMQYNSKAATVLETGWEINQIDLIFDIQGFNVVNLITKFQNNNLADLSDIYDDALDGYGDTNNTLNDLLYPFFKETVTYFNDGKQYGVPWALGLEGLVYNASLFSQYNLSVPKTTDELIALSEEITKLNNGGYVKNGNDNVYPFLYSSSTYSEYLVTPWWVQYEGLTEYYNYLEGWCSEHELYDSCVIKQMGRYEAIDVVANMYAFENGYANPNCPGYAFGKAQTLFLDGLSFMLATGDWVEREMQATIKEKEELAASKGETYVAPDIRFMKLPVISAIIDNLPQGSIEDDATLSQVVAYIDGEIATAPAGVHADDIEYVRIARTLSMVETGHSAIVPADSPKIDLAKDFLKYMLSAKGQNVLMKYSLGNRSPLMVDVSSYDSYNDLSTFAKSKQTLMDGANLVGRHYYTKMTLLGGLQIFSSNVSTRESTLGKDPNKQGDGYKSAVTLFNEEFDYYDNRWDDMLVSARLSATSPAPSHLNNN